MLDDSAPLAYRRQSLQSLVDNQTAGIAESLQRLLSDDDMRLNAIRGLGSYSHPDTPQLLLAAYAKYSAIEKQAALDTLASRVGYAEKLLDALTSGTVRSGEVTAYTARQIRNLRNAGLTRRLKRVWGEVRTTSNDKRKALARYKRMLSGEGMQGADRSHGRQIYNQTCLKCHKLFGIGGAIGPDLTGSNRYNLDYVLENVVDPSAVVGKDFQMRVVKTKKGRIVTGIVVEKTDSRWTLQSADRRIVIAAADVSSTRLSETSMMPDGQLDKLDEKSIRDLVAYLASPMQVDLPKGVSQPIIKP